MSDARLYEVLGERIERARVAAGLTQAQLAKLVLVPKVALTDIERGRSPVELHIVYRIACACGVAATVILPTKREIGL